MKSKNEIIEKYRRYFSESLAARSNGLYDSIFGDGCFLTKAESEHQAVIKQVKDLTLADTRYVSNIKTEEGVAHAPLKGKVGEAEMPAPVSPVSPLLVRQIIKEGQGASASDIAKRSPIPVDWQPVEEFKMIMRHLYSPREHLFLGHDQTPGVPHISIRTVENWRAYFRRNKTMTFPKWLPNPLTGYAAPKDTGSGFTLRGEGNVDDRRFVVVEHDTLSLAQQLAYWYASPLPVAALIYSGNKSIHAILRVDCSDRDEWKGLIEDLLFPLYLAPQGFNNACINASRLSRAPGHLREDTGNLQACIYLAPDGKAVSA